MKYCKNCGTALQDDMKFCTSCGQRVEQVLYCTHCGKPLEEGARFCRHCGQAVYKEDTVLKRRTYLEIRPKINVDVSSYIREILINQGYQLKDYYGEEVWKKGVGLLTAMQYIKIESITPQKVLLSGWIQMGVGSVGLAEQDLEGVVGVIPKKSVKKTMELIQLALERSV